MGEGERSEGGGLIGNCIMHGMQWGGLQHDLKSEST